MTTEITEIEKLRTQLRGRRSLYGMTLTKLRNGDSIDTIRMVVENAISRYITEVAERQRFVAAQLKIRDKEAGK